MNFSDIIKAIIDVIFKPKPPVPTPTPIPPSGDFASQLLQLHNNHRQAMGLTPLVLDARLNSASQKHSNWMFSNNNMNHFEGNRGPGDRISAEGYKWRAYGENIAYGYATPQAVFQGWLSSSGHRANIENPAFKDVGFGLAGKYWTTDFGSQSSHIALMSLSGPLKLE